MVGSKLTYPKWHFGQVEHGDNWGIFWSISSIQKTTFFNSKTSYKQIQSCSKLYMITFNMHIHKIKTRGIVNYESIKLNTSQNSICHSCHKMNIGILLILPTKNVKISLKCMNRNKSSKIIIPKLKRNINI
jgi:hypothetical protein